MLGLGEEGEVGEIAPGGSGVELEWYIVDIEQVVGEGNSGE